MVFLVNDTLVKVNAGIAYPAAQGGTATYCAGIINYLSGKNMKFGLIGNFDSYEKEMVLKKINASSNFKFLFNLFCLFSQRRFLRHGILYFQRPDHLAFSVLSSARKVLHLHGQSYSNIQQRKNSFVRLFYTILEKIGISHAGLIIATDKKTYDLYANLYPKVKSRMFIVPTGIDFSFYKEKSHSNVPTDFQSKMFLLYAGRLSRPKRIADMFATFEVALTINTDLQFIMVGDGPLFNKLISLVNRKHLNENVHFLGQLPKPELRGWMQSCEAGILLSHNKSSPISVKEYLACGKPVVANNVGDIADYIIDDHTGFIVNPDNPEQVAKAILACVDNSFAFHDNCVRMAEKYDERVINEKLFQLIRQFDHATT